MTVSGHQSVSRHIAFLMCALKSTGLGYLHLSPLASVGLVDTSAGTAATTLDPEIKTMC